MNKVILKGRLTRDPQVTFTSGENPVMVAKFTLASDDRERGKDADGQYPANFIPCIAMGKLGEIAHANLCKGKEVLLCGKMQSGSYENKEGKRIYTLECFVKELEFCGRKEDSLMPEGAFMDIPDGLDDELPFA